MKTINYSMRKCPSCGSNKVSYDSKSHILTCSFCNSAYYIEDEKTVQDHKKKQNLVHISCILTIAIIFLICCISFFRKSHKDENKKVSKVTTTVAPTIQALNSPTPTIIVTPEVEEEEEKEDIGIFQNIFLANVMSRIYQKAPKDITQEDLNQLKYLDLDFGYSGCYHGYNDEGVQIQYSFEDLTDVNEEMRKNMIQTEYYTQENLLPGVYIEGDMKDFSLDLHLLSELTVFHTDYDSLVYQAFIETPKLKELSLIGFSSIEQVSEVVEPSQITSLTLGTELKDIEGLDQFINIVHLSFDEGNFDSFEPLKLLPKLKSLSLNHTYHQTGIDVLSSLTELEELTIDSLWGPNFDISLLKTMSHLKKLSISYSSLVNIEEFENLPILEELTLRDNNYLGLYKFVYKQDQLTKLCIDMSGNEDDVDKINKWFSNCTKLENVYLSSVENASILANLKNVKKLEIDGYDLEGLTEKTGNLNQLTDFTIRDCYTNSNEVIDFILKQENIKKLALINCSFKDEISSLFTLKNLKSLDLSDTYIKIDFDQKAQLDELESLTLSKTYVYDEINCKKEEDSFFFDPPKELVSRFILWLNVDDTVQYLDISGDNQQDGSFLSAFYNLKHLNIAENNMDNLDAKTLENCKKLTRLNVSMNSFDSIEFANNIPSLEEFNISEMEELKYGLDLSELSNLKLVIRKKTKADLLMIPSSCTLITY